MLIRLFTVISALWVLFVFWATYRNAQGFGEAETIFALSVPGALLVLYVSGRWIKAGLRR